MNTQTLKSGRSRSKLFIDLFLVLAILSCSTLNSYATPPAANTATSQPTSTSTPVSTQTPTSVPALGYRSIWRQSRIAFASNRSGGFQIYLMKPDGSQLTQLTNSSGDNLEPAWSKDAQHIAFASTRDGNSEIYVMNPDGTGQKNISHDPSNDYSPIWLPDNKIAFISNRSGRERIFVMSADGTNIQSYKYTSLDSTDRFFCITWLGESFLSFSVQGSASRLVRAVDTTNGDVATPDILNNGDALACPLLPTLVSDRWMIFVSNRDGHDEIYKSDPQNNDEVQLTKNSAPSLGPSRSSDESWIAFYSKRSGNWDIFVMNINGKDQWNITNDPADDIQPAWEPY